MQAPYYVIKLQRYHLGLTQEEAAKSAGVSRTAFINAEKGRSVSPSTYGKIRKALGITE